MFPCVLAAPQLLVPLLFFLCERGVEGCGLAAVEVERGGFEERGGARDEDVFDG